MHGCPRELSELTGHAPVPVVMMFASQILYLFIFLFAPLVSSESIQSRALKVYSFSTLIENIECDSRTDVKKCSKFTLYHIYAFAARVPPSGAGGYITDEPGFACNHVEPPSDNTVEWAALVYYSSVSCDCSYEEKIVHVQAAGYKIALLMELGTQDCSDVIGNNDTNVTNITIPAVLLSATVGLLLLRYSSPTDARPIGSVIVEALYTPDPDYKVIGIVVGSIFGPILIMFILIAFYFCICWKCKQRRRRQQYKTLSKAKSKNLPKSEPPELTSSQAGHVNIPLQEINSNKQHGKKYGTVSGSTILTNDDAVGPQLKLQVNNNQDDKNKN